MIYGEKFLNERFGGESAEINKDLDEIYKEYKAKIDQEFAGSQAAFRAENYSKAKTCCNNVIKHANAMISKLNKINTTQMNGIGRAKRNKYIKYATRMIDEAKLGIEESDKRKNVK